MGRSRMDMPKLKERCAQCTEWDGKYFSPYTDTVCARGISVICRRQSSKRCPYFCKKNKVYVNAAKTTCEHYEKSYRQKDLDSDIYEDSKEYYDNDTPLSFYIVILIVLIIIGLIMGVFTIN